MLRFIRSFFAWELFWDQGVWLYEENQVTGQRRAGRRSGGCWSPIDYDWLDAGIGHPTINGIPARRVAPGRYVNG